MPTAAVGGGADVTSDELGVLENPLIRAPTAAFTPAFARNIASASADAVQPSHSAGGGHDAAATRVSVPNVYTSDDGENDGGGIGGLSEAERVQLARTLSVYNPAAGGLAVIDGAGRRGFAAHRLDAPQPSSSVATSALPAGWRVRYSRTKRAAYYFNDATGESSWSLPADELSAQGRAETSADATLAAATTDGALVTPEAAARTAESGAVGAAPAAATTVEAAAAWAAPATDEALADAPLDSPRARRQRRGRRRRSSARRLEASDAAAAAEANFVEDDDDLEL